MKLFKSLIIITPVLALVSPVIILSNTGCGNPEIKYLPDGSDWVGYIEGSLNYSFDVNNHTYTITSNNSYVANNLVIPDTVIIDDVSYIVITIGNYALNDCVGLTGDLIIPNSVTSIGRGAFQGDENISGLSIGNNVTRIGEFAFNHCYGLTGDLVIPNSVTSIDKAAFQGDTNISGLSIGNNVTTIGQQTFFNCNGITGDLVIPNSVTSIGRGAFSGCIGITGDLVIPNSMTTIGEYAFNGCVGLTGDLIIPNSVTTIGEYAFNHCEGLTTNLVIPDSVTTIGLTAFQCCIGLDSIILPNALVGLNSYVCGMGLASNYNPDTFKLQSIKFTNIDTVEQIIFADNFFGDSGDIDLESKGVKVYVPDSVRDTYVTKITGISVGQKFSAENIIGY